MKKLLWAAALLGACGMFRPALAQEETTAKIDPDSKWLVFSVNDESTMEEKIGEYLRTVKKLNVSYTYAKSDPSDLILKIHFTLDPKPDVMLNVDTLSSSRDGTERCITVRAWYILPDRFKKSASDMDRIRRYNERFMEKYFAPERVYVDKDDDLAMSCYLNVPGKDTPVHAEFVADLVARMAGAWTTYFKGFTEEIGNPL